jgi:hypothetical protein
LKYLLLLQFLLFSFLSFSQSITLYIPPNSSIELDDNNYDLNGLDIFGLKIKNKSLSTIGVRVENKITGEFTSGFGLGPLGKEGIVISKGDVVIFSNNTQKSVKLKTTYFIPQEENNFISKETESISFTLNNSSLKSIPLIIPNVMNPNLSPLSNSGVDLKIGQEIFFKNKGKKILLLRVSDKIKEGEIIDVNQLIKNIIEKTSN